MERPKRIEQASSVPSEPLSANDMTGKHDALLEHPQIQRTEHELTAIEMETDASMGTRTGADLLDVRIWPCSRHKLTAMQISYLLRQLKLIQANDDASNAPVPIRRGIC